MKAQEIREIFIDFFANKNHKIIKSSSLLPKDDPQRFCGGVDTHNLDKVSRQWGEEIVSSQVKSLRRHVFELLGGTTGQHRRPYKRTHREMYDRWPSYVEAFDSSADLADSRIRFGRETRLDDML